MKTIRGAKLCYVLSVLMCFGFVVNTAVDYRRYTTTLNSAPFSLWVAVNGICFLVPAIVVLVVGVIMNRKLRSGGK